MNVFAIGDLHLPGGQEKPMDVFGARWKDHAENIGKNWGRFVTDDDVVLIPGDFSWAMTLEQVKSDFNYLAELPGRKILIRGNHDYWWQGIGKVRRALPENVEAIQNDYVHVAGGWAICGTRGWIIPNHPEFDQNDERLLARETHRLELSLEAACDAGLKPAIVMLHYPPCSYQGDETDFTRLLEAYDVQLCVYGHLHGEAGRLAIQGDLRGVRYVLTACDALNFSPKLVGRCDDDGRFQTVV